MFELDPLQWEATERHGNVFNGLGRSDARLGLGLRQEALLPGHGQQFLELLEGLGKGGRGEAKHVGHVLGLAGGPRLLEDEVDAAGQHGVPTEPLASSNLLEGTVHGPGRFEDGLVDSVIQANQGEALAGLNDGALLVGDRVPGVVFAHLEHGPGLASVGPAENDGAERGERERRVLGSTDTGGVAAPIVVAKEAVFRRRIKGTANYMAATAARHEFRLVKTVLHLAMRAGIGIYIGMGGGMVVLRKPRDNKFSRGARHRGLLKLGKNGFHTL